MAAIGKIITVGVCPCWDLICRVNGIDWGEHKVLSSACNQPAGKALNICRALAWMETQSTAAGLWGQLDFDPMLESLQPWKKFIKVKFTCAAGATRGNITVVDTARNRDMHLRSVSDLASEKSLTALKADLQFLVKRNSVCVFAGAMPQKRFLSNVSGLMDSCLAGKAKIAIDTSGAALRRIVERGNVWLVKPNIQELGELLQQDIRDSVDSLVKAASKLLDRVEIVLISRGRKGAIAVTRQGAWLGRCVRFTGKVVSTVGCGDYLLAGFLKGLKDKANVKSALQAAVKAATARAWDWPTEKTWLQAEKQIRAQTTNII